MIDKNFFKIFRIYNSPFVKLKFNFYFGKIRYGTPYFYPRRVVRSKENPGYLEFKNVKYLWLDIIGLGYKTKWSNIDYRFEWSPLISLVIFGKQLVITVLPDISDSFALSDYWEAWLFYENNTSKELSKEERIKELLKYMGLTGTIHTKDEVKVYNNFDTIFKNKYHHLK